MDCGDRGMNEVLYAILRNLQQDEEYPMHIYFCHLNPYVIIP